MNVSIIGSRGYPYVYSGYETFVKELSERLVKKNVKVTIFCHKGLFKDRPNKLNNINLIYIPTIETKSLSQLIHSFLFYNYYIRSCESWRYLISSSVLYLPRHSFLYGYLPNF